MLRSSLLCAADIGLWESGMGMKLEPEQSLVRGRCVSRYGIEVMLRQHSSHAGNKMQAGTRGRAIFLLAGLSSSGVKL